MKIKKIAVYMLICVIVLTCFSGCAKSSGDSLSNTNDAEQITYIESELSGMSKISTIYTFENEGDGWYIMASNYGDYSSFVVMYSDNQGVDWNDAGVSISSDIYEITGDDFIFAADIMLTDDGLEYLISYRNNDDYDNAGILYIDSEGNGTKLVDWSDSNSVKCLEFSEDGKSFFAGSGDFLRRYDLDGNLLNDYNISNVIDFCENGENLVVLTKEYLYEFETETGNGVFNDDIFAINLPDEMDTAETNVYGVIGTCSKVLRCTGDDEIYLLLSTGIYKYTLNTTYIEQIVDNEKNSFSDLRLMFNSYIVYNDNFYVLSTRKTNSYMSCLVYSESVDNNVINHTITVYSLYPNEMLEELAIIYERNNRDVDVEIEIGIEEGSSITVDEAVAALNASMLAGNGPDVIITDNLNVGNLQRNGLLLEISDVYDGILEEYPNCLVNIMSAYKTEDGIYAIPSRFKFTVLVAPRDEIEDLDDMGALAEYINQGDEPTAGNDLNVYEWEDLFYSIYPVYSSGIVSLDGEYSEENMRDFIIEFKELWDALMAHTSEEDIDDWEKAMDDYASNGYVLGDGTVYFENNAMKRLYKMQNAESTGQKLGLAELNSQWDEFVLYSTINSEDLANSNYIYKIFSDDEKYVFTPTMTAAIYAGSGDVDAAKSFVKSMFSIDEQNFYGCSFTEKDGSCVNVDAIDDYLESYGGGSILGGSDGYTIYYGFQTDEDYDEYIENISSLDTSANTDVIIREMIMENMEDYLSGKLTVDEYMDELNDSVALYKGED